jgi:hypothetical protein
MNENDMTAPVTRGELKQELAELKAELKVDLDQALVDVVRKPDLDRALDAWGTRLSVELAQHVNAMTESLRAEFRGIDDQYKDLPARVSKLENAVFTPKPARRRRSS